MSESGIPQERKHNPFISSAFGTKALNALHQPFFMIHRPKGFGIMTTIGRRTGKKRRRCVRIIVDGNTAYLVMLGPVLAPNDPNPTAHWLRNIRANPRVRLRITGGSVVGYARELALPDELKAARGVYSDTVNPFDFFEYYFHIGEKATQEKIRRMHEHWFDSGVPIAINLSSQAS